METWAWLTAYVVGFGLLQVLLYRYVRRCDPSPETTASGAESRESGRARADRTATDATADAVACPHCGTENESHPAVEYCRACAASLR